VEHAEYLDFLSSDAIGHQIANPGHDQFARTRDATRPTQTGLFDQLIDGCEHPADNKARCGRILGRDVGGFLV
jgi:hypothetical protein